MRPAKQYDLTGRSVFLAGDGFYSRRLKEELEAAGVTIVCPTHAAADGLTGTEHAQALVREIIAAQPKPDAVILYHPRMDLHDGPFPGTPAIELARAIKPHGIPTLILDQFRGMDAASARVVQDAGARFIPLDTFHMSQAVPAVAQLIAHRSPTGRPPQR